MIEDFDNIAFRKIMTMAVSKHFLHTKPSIGQRFIFMLRKGTDFSKELVKKSWGKESANESSSKFIPHFNSSFVEFVQPCFRFSRSALVLPSNWFPLTRIKWLPLIANSFAISGLVIVEPGVGATTQSVAHMGSSSIGSAALLTILKSLKKRRRSFKFTNYIMDKEDFLPTTEKEWNQEIMGQDMYRVVKKLKDIKQPMRKLNWKNGNLTEKVELYRDKLKADQKDMAGNPHNEIMKANEAECLAEYLIALNDVEKFLF
ncbi:hypothetical protein Tco_0748083 [Tanacetum coccineum]|uniref:Uncharacterized protein n=1 Tax=Tanacetum coccineum TaxID=301880 RepID=A0ABQ4YVD2_9ASTR